MKKIILILLASIIFFKGYCQNESSVNIGFSLPIFFKNSLYWDVVSKGKTHISGINLFFEKPFRITTEKINLTIEPGLFYDSYSESKQSPTSALGGSSGASYKHKSTGVYNKLLLDVITFSPRKNIVYSGVLTGIYLYTKTSGDESKSFPYNDPPYYWSSSTNGNGKLFYNQFLFGLIVGLKPNLNDPVLVPALELTFFPYYAKLIDYNTIRKDLTKYNSMLSISVILGINIKKAAQNKRL